MMAKKRPNNKRKGSDGEREVVKILKYATGTDEWKRVPGSGMLATSHGHEMFRGDVYCQGEDGYKEVVIEVKNYKGAVSLNDIFGEKSKFNSWAHQLEMERGDRPGMLFFKSNGKWFWTNADKSHELLNKRMMCISKCWYCFGKVNKTVDEIHKILKEKKNG